MQIFLQKKKSDVLQLWTLRRLSTLSGYTLKLQKMIGGTASIIGIVQLAGGLKAQTRKALDIALAVVRRWTEVQIMDEYIERGALLARLEEMSSYNVSPMYQRGYDDCIASVLKMTAADVAPVVHSKWLLVYEPAVDDWEMNCNYVCTECGYPIATYAKGKGLTNYCPNCGAKMDKEGEKRETD